MKKILILILTIPFLAASCDTGGIFDFGGGTRGVFKSEDSGETYNLSTKLIKKGDISSLSINALGYDQSNPDILYAGTTSGIYKSEDGAKTWKYILAGITVSDLTVDRFDPSIIYASGLYGQNGKIIKSTDGGTSWVDIYTEPSKTNTVISITVSTVSASTVLAGLNNGELVRSTDAGRSWQTTHDFADKVIEVKFGANATAYALTAHKGLYKSNDLGMTWTELTNALITDSINSVSRGSSSVTAFYDVALDLKQSGVLYLGTEQGLFRSVNDGKDWSFLSLPLKNAALRVSAITVNPSNSNNLYAAVVSTVYKSVNGGLTWETRTLPTTTYVHTIVIDPLNTNIIYLGLRAQ
ncbi:MAG: hypothetical protein KW802_00130 [Candidatus Doudnabacteria bacterium]|nr:hypothetical protein [Candidatus Doudnabacteria bacterium]